MRDGAPDHSSLTVIRQRLPPLELHEEVFAFVLRILVERGLYDGKTLTVDATMLETRGRVFYHRDLVEIERYADAPARCVTAIGLGITRVQCAGRWELFQRAWDRNEGCSVISANASVPKEERTGRPS